MIKFPKHKCELILSHNAHKTSYTSVDEYTRFDLNGDCWISEEQKEKAYKTQEYWELHWYPDTPVGFIRFWAADLDALLEYCKEK